MAVRSNRLAGPTSVAAGASVQMFTCPAGRTALVKFLVAAYISGSSGFANWCLNGTGSGDRIYRHGVTSNSVDNFQQVFMVLEPGDVLWVVSFNAAFTASVHGALLDGAPA